jgi:hypothetical protein
MKLTLDPMAALRAARVEAVNRNFGMAAIETLHLDLVALARGDVSAIEAREARRQKLLDAIEAAATPAELDRISDVLAGT